MYLSNCFFWRGKILQYTAGILDCCVFRPVNACVGMHSHGRKQWKTFKNYEKVPFSSCTRETHERLTRKTIEILYVTIVHRVLWKVELYEILFSYKIPRKSISGQTIWIPDRLAFQNRTFENWMTFHHPNAKLIWYSVLHY